jgi:hypothetical protein
MSETSYSNKCAILSQVWLEFRDDENFKEFMSYGDLGLPLAYAIDNGVVKNTDEAQKFVEEVFELLLGILGLDEDTGFDNLDELLGFTADDIEDDEDEE